MLKQLATCCNSSLKQFLRSGCLHGQSVDQYNYLMQAITSHYSTYNSRSNSIFKEREFFDKETGHMFPLSFSRVQCVNPYATADVPCKFISAGTYHFLLSKCLCDCRRKLGVKVKLLHLGYVPLVNLRGSTGIKIRKEPLVPLEGKSLRE